MNRLANPLQLPVPALVAAVGDCAAYCCLTIYAV